MPKYSNTKTGDKKDTQIQNIKASVLETNLAVAAKLKNRTWHIFGTL